MEIFTLLRANIRHKKGAFKSIIILICIITLCFTTVLSTNDNIDRSINEAMEYVDANDCLIFITTEKELNDD